MTPTAILNANILIVDDLPANVLLLSRMLLSAGYTSVASTSDPSEVYKNHREHHYDLILLDLKMPHLDGFEVMEQLKKIEPEGYLPVIVITAQPAHKLRALHAGAKDFISAPFELTEVLARVHNMLEVRLLHKELRHHSEALEQRVSERTTQLSQSEQRSRLLIAGIKDYAIIMLDLHGRVLTWNDGAQRLKGYTEAEIVGQSMECFYPAQATAAGVPEGLLARAVADGHCEDEGWRVRKDGTLFFADVVVTAMHDPAGKVMGFAKITRDITERRQAQQEIGKQRAFLRQVIDLDRNFIFAKDREGRFTMANQAIAESYDTTVDDMIGKTDCELGLNREEIEHFRRDDLEVMDSLQEKFIREEQITDASGSVRWLQTVKRPMLNPLGQVDMVLGVATDITERVQVERALQRSEEQLKRGQRLAQMGTLIRNRETDSWEWSDETYRILGVSRENFDVSRENFLALFHPDDREEAAAISSQIMAGVAPAPIEARIVRPDGSVRHVHREWELIPDSTGERRQVLGIIQDVTERRLTEEQLRQAQKMEAVGNLTGGMAHDFNNLLSVIIGNIDLLQDLKKDDPDVTELTRDALDAAFRGADLTHRLLAFARQQPLQPKEVDVNEMVSDIIKLLGRTLGENIEISLDLAKDAWTAVVDPARLEATLVNLANNARDAMPRGGKLRIATANQHLDDDYASQHIEVIAGDYLLIEISDTGTGMSPAVINRIFEPFFTTKGDKGTGLGLAMVFGFIKQSNGHINVYSELGTGTTFRLYLPHASVPATESIEAGRPSAVRGGGETILVVEDNAPLRRIAMRQLGELGYRVQEAENAAAALKLLEQKTTDLILTDIVMPGGTDGIKLARNALLRWPTLKVVFTSGFAGAHLNGTAKSLPDNALLLTKPYRRGDLATIVRSALDTASDAILRPGVL